MALHRTTAVVIGRRDLGESDRIVEFYTLEFGKLRGVAKAARRTRSRFGSALEPFTLGELVFFDTGRSELVRVDHFDIVKPFVEVREHLERLGQGAWAIECVARLSAERDAHPALFRLLVRTIGTLARSERPAWVSVCFALRAIDLLGHRPRLDRCLSCGRVYPFPDPSLDVALGSVACADCARGADAIALSGSAVGALIRLRTLRWDDALRLTLAPDLSHELGGIVEGMVARLVGHPPRASRFLVQVRRSLAQVAEPAPPRVRR
jgi:DNA repair protein RecO (recombination protein O)